MNPVIAGRVNPMAPGFPIINLYIMKIEQQKPNKQNIYTFTLMMKMTLSFSAMYIIQWEMKMK